VAPQDPSGYFRTGGLRHAQRRYQEAKGYYEQALARDPNFATALIGLIGIYTQQKQPDRSIALVNEQIAKAPKNSTYYLLLGQLLAREKDFEKAEAALQKAVELDNNNVDAFLALGEVQRARGSLDRAAASYQRSIQQNPRDLRGYVLLGYLKETQGDWQKAEELYQKALQVDPENPISANNLAYLMLEHGGNVDVALSLAQVARRGALEIPNVEGTLAWAYYHKAAYRPAIDLLEEAVSKDRRNATLEYHLGLAYQKVGDRARAKQHLQRALEIDAKIAQSDEIRKALAELAKR
jgi:tetratricopeptide (TPR) repeat protein